jgi:sulfur carrier protein
VDAETTDKIHIRLNGQTKAIAAPATVSALISERRPQPPFAVEVNAQLVRRDGYATTELRDGDHIEIVTLVGGG